MTKFVDSLGLKKLVTKIGEAVGNGTWLPVKKGEGQGAVVMGSDDNQALGNYSHAEGDNSSAMESCSHAEGENASAKGEASHAEGFSTIARGIHSHAEGNSTEAKGKDSHAEGSGTMAQGESSHAEGNTTTASGSASHAQGFYNYDDPSFIDMVGVGDDNTNKNASVIYVKRDEEGYPNQSDPKNGYQYLLGVGGYQGQDIAEGMKSVQEVIADLEKGVAASETMTVEDIREIMSA